MTIQMRLDPDIHDAAKRAAALEGVSLSEYLRRLLQRNLEEEANGGVGGEGEADGGTGSKNDGESPRIR